MKRKNTGLTPLQAHKLAVTDALMKAVSAYTQEEGTMLCPWCNGVLYWSNNHKPGKAQRIKVSCQTTQNCIGSVGRF